MRAPSWLRKSLALRLALVYGLLSVLVVSLMGLGIYGLAARYLRSAAERDLKALAGFYAAYLATTAPDADRLGTLAPELLRLFTPQANHDLRLFNARNGALLASTRDLGPLPSLAALSELGYRRPTLFVAGSKDQPGRAYSVSSLTASDGTPLAVIEVSRDMGEVESFLGTLRWVLFGAGGMALVAASLVSLWLGGQTARPLRQIESATEVIAAGDFSRRLSVGREDEIGRLAASINRMAAELARLEATRHEFIARISHDLRTPLTAIKGLVINLQDTAPETMQASLSTMDEQTDRLIRLVNDLLALSRLQRGELRLVRAQTDLAAVVYSAVSLASEKARRLGVALTADLSSPLPPVQGDADRLQQVVLNLLDNALRATPAAGAVKVQVAAEGEEIVLRITDNGRGLTSEEAAHAFEPTFRGPGGGAGLGLTIARDLVLAHGGRIWLQNRPEGGAEAGFALPC